jgi:CheY-like chemotaxis protein
MGKVLVVDDKELMRDSVAAILSRKGHAVVTAPDARAALARIADKRPECVVTDLQMPGMNGLELAQALASDAQFSEIPVLLLTARGHLLHEGEARSGNIVGLMHKPFSPRALLAEVVAILAARAANRKRGAA